MESECGNIVVWASRPCWLWVPAHLLLTTQQGVTEALQMWSWLQINIKSTKVWILQKNYYCQREEATQEPMKLEQKFCHVLLTDWMLSRQEDSYL